MENENQEIISRKFNFKKIFSKVRLTRKNIGWWFFSGFILIIIIGIIMSWINPELTYFAPILWIIDLLVLPFGEDLASIDYRMPTILEGLATGASLTFWISIISVVVGFIFAIFLAVILVNRTKLFGLKMAAQFYVDFFRSTPLLVQILLVYFGLPSGVISLIRDMGISTEIFAGTLALSLNTAAYQAEIIRSGILAIPIGQTEAARALGLTTTQTMRYVVLPQAVRMIVPPLTNEIINVLLNSSLTSAIGVTEITKRSQSLQARYFLWPVFLIAALYYFVLAYSSSKLTKKLEIKLRIPGLGVAND
ncbi:amino acid ABC transporter permease [Promethearchaeum syntrophicum]|uniref:Amino acid ABC transporter permease n=1 Tax=Promethearchaeum syntrophicum TaxID=2594042 RepID=A0A5B9D5W4_9ARCH|nr:amino acid ABC transporter permease [Candidatus Prometheoarchaeum syntrophicum]QEE14210.1 glutamine ABC transporter permease protein [Candidatus Prometheoarchaeum syntrophicum]